MPGSAGHPCQTRRPRIETRAPGGVLKNEKHPSGAMEVVEQLTQPEPVAGDLPARARPERVRPNQKPTEPEQPKYKWVVMHGQRVRVTICPPGKANAPTLLSELRDEPAARYEQRARHSGIAKSSHDGGHSHPHGYEADDDADLDGEIRQTRGAWISRQHVAREPSRPAQRHHLRRGLAVQGGTEFLSDAVGPGTNRVRGQVRVSLCGEYLRMPEYLRDDRQAEPRVDTG